MRRLALAAILLLCPPAAAQGLVQISLSGDVDRNGGARAELGIRFADASGTRDVSVSVWLAERTSSADLAVLLTRRLEAAGVRVLHAAEGQAARPQSVLFVEDVLAVSLRMGQGLKASVTLCEDRPDTVRLDPPEDAKSAAVLNVTASTWQPHLRTRGRSELELRFEADATPARIADRLASEGIRGGWPGDVERHEVWRPGLIAGQAEVRGASFDLASDGDWRLEIGLAPRMQAR
jgi:hypothetical protein